MSPREKKLIIFFAVGGFVVLNFIVYSWYSTASAAARTSVLDARLEVERAEFNQASAADIAEQMEWLAERLPEPAAYQEIQSELQQFVEQQARAAGLTIRGQRLMPINDTGAHFHRAGVQIEVTGREDALYRWFDQIKSLDDFRATTSILMNPNREDDTLIDCRAVIEQWFIPADPGA